MKHSLACLIICTLLMSCYTMKSLRELNREEAKIYSYTYKNKDIKFCPMHHLGKKEFYSDVSKKINEYKKNGYVIFYELISTNFTADSVEKDIIRRKARKIKGFSGTYKDMVKDNSMFDKYVQQPSYKDLGIDSNDIRADIDYKSLIVEYENKFGKIELDSVDMNTNFGEAYNRKELMKKDEYRYVIIEYRNNKLLELVSKASYNKILILYGEGHRADFENKLK